MANRNLWHAMDTEQISVRLETNAASGLSRKQASSRAKKLNIRQPEALQPLFLPVKKPLYLHMGKMLLDPIIILTLAVAVITLFFKQYVLGGMIVAVLLLNAVCCAIAITKAHDVWHKLQLYSNPMTKVVRGGRLYTTDARNVLPGDVVLLSAGDICPADIRLDRGGVLRVTQYALQSDAEGGYIRQTVIKNGDTAYLRGDDIHSPDCENIVYAGSVIEQGIARGIAVETGKHTYIGAAFGTVPGTQDVHDPDSIHHIRKYFSRFSAVQAVLLIPLTVLLTVTLRGTLSFAECFLTALALCCTVVAERIVSLAAIVRATGIDAAASQSENEAVAIIKNNEASDKLCEMTDLLLLDSAAISDGKYHLESVYAGGSIYNNRELINPDVLRLAKDLYLYRSATKPLQASDVNSPDIGLTAQIDAMIKHVGLDTEAIKLTLKSSSMRFENGIYISHNQLTSGECDVMISSEEDLLSECTHVLSGEHRKVLDDSEHIGLRTLCRIYRESGYRILLVADRQGEHVTLTGVLAFAHRIGFGFAECCNELIDSGVRISVFMPNDSQTMKTLTDSGLVRDESNDVLTAVRAQEEGLDLHVAYGSYRAYLGFSQTQIAELIEKLKQRGACVASYCVDRESQKLHEMADLTITCDAIEYRSGKAAESLYDKMPIDGKPFSSRASQHTRRMSDVILRRAGDSGGGLHGILTGRKYAFAINHNLANAMTYLITVQFFRAVMLIVPALFGTFTLSAVSLLIFGLVLDVAAVCLFAFAKPNEATCTCGYPILRRLEKPIAYNTANVISACVSAMLLWLGVALLQVFGILDAAQCTGLCFLSTYLLQGVVFAVTLREYAVKKNKNRPFAVALVTAVCYVVLLLGCLLIPGLRGLTVGTRVLPMTLLMTPFAALIYYIMYRVLTARGLNLHR